MKAAVASNLRAAGPWALCLLLAALPLVLVSAPRLADVETRCPLFGHAFTAQALAGGEDGVAAFDSDLCKRPASGDLYTLSVWTCPFCFFSAYQADYLTELDPEFRDLELRTYPLEKRPAEVEQWDIFVGLKYHNAETFYLKQGRDAWFLHDLMLRATYACRVSTVLETGRFREMREQWIDRAWPQETRFSVEDVNLALARLVQQELDGGAVEAASAPMHRYLLADALRRAGEHREAAALFEALTQEASLPASERNGALMQLLLCRKEAEFQEKALSYLEQARKEGLVPEENRALSIYLQGELSRRLGRAKEARALYRRAAKLPAPQDWLGAIIEKQQGRLAGPGAASRPGS